MGRAEALCPIGREVSRVGVMTAQRTNAGRENQR